MDSCGTPFERKPCADCGRDDVGVIEGRFVQHGTITGPAMVKPCPRSGQPVSWAAEVIADDSGKWCGNGLRFATEQEARWYVDDLMMRWLAVRDTRTVPSGDVVTDSITRNADGVLERRSLERRS